MFKVFPCISQLVQAPKTIKFKPETNLKIARVHQESLHPDAQVGGHLDDRLLLLVAPAYHHVPLLVTDLLLDQGHPLEAAGVGGDEAGEDDEDGDHVDMVTVTGLEAG